MSLSAPSVPELAGQRERSPEMEDFDMFDLDEDPSQAPAAAPMFKPKGRNIKSKPNSKPQVKQEVPEPKTETLAPISKKKEEEEEEPPESKPSHIAKGKPLEAAATASPMEVEEVPEEEEEDVVVREIDVFFSPSPSIGDDSQLYVMQYPLRPCWRPYELDNRCEEVRVKPGSAEVEVDVSLDVDSQNYDRGKSAGLERMKKQTLSSKWKPPRTMGYAVGVLIGNKLHLNPIHAVVQLRPSMQHFIGPKMTNNSSDDVDVSVKSEELKEKSIAPPKKQNKQKGVPNDTTMSDAKSWVSLKYHGSESELKSKYLQKMTTKESSPIQFSMSPYDYIDTFCPVTVSNNKLKDPSRRLLSLSLEERIRTWLLEGPSVHRFNYLKHHLAPNDSAEDVLQVLKEYARLVQGLWVPKSKYLCQGRDGLELVARDYVILQFSKNPIIKKKYLDDQFSTNTNKNEKLYQRIKVILKQLAIERPLLNDWKFKEPTDVSFIKLYPHIVEEQIPLLDASEKQLASFIGRGSGPGAKGSSIKPASPLPGTSMNSIKGDTALANESASQRRIMPNEMRVAVLKVLKILFQTHQVRSFQMITEGLQDLAGPQSTLKGDANTASAAAYALDASKEELEEVLNQVAIYIHGVYALKSSVAFPEYDPFRDVVINLFRVKGPNAKIRKADFLEAAKIALKRTVPNNEFTKVIHELCVSNSSGWCLRSPA